MASMYFNLFFDIIFVVYQFNIFIKLMKLIFSDFH